MSLPELLAPAGSFDAAISAFTYGADAIYLGLSRFSARADAANFSDEELAQIIAYARNLPRPRKVYVTLNTLIETSEMTALLPTLSLLERLRIDGAIVQDLGLAARIHRDFPGIPLHASTQLACTSLAGARALKALGFVRIVTARELTLEEAAEIGEKADIEIEVFVHGALCYSVSGLCLFSSLTTGRSGNRGRCAYCCRQAFGEILPTGEGLRATHPFSMRDLALIPCGDKLRSLPLASLKIEGRMKNPLYVAAVTDLYRALLDGKLTPALEKEKTENLRTIFSRPWTTLYATSADTSPEAIIDAHCVGHRGAPIGRVLRVMRDTDGLFWLTFDTARALEKHDGLQIDPPEGGRPIGFAALKLRDSRTKRAALTLPAGTRVDVALPPDVKEIPRGATVYCSASQAVRRAFPISKPRTTELRTLLPADLTLTLSAEAITLSGHGVTVSTPANLTPAKDPSQTAAAAQKLLSRLGEEGYFLRSLTLHDHGLFLPAGLLNATRRAWAEEARTKATTDAPKRALSEVVSPIPPRPARDEARWTLKVSALQSPDLLGEKRPDRVVVTLTDHTKFAELQPWIAHVPREQLRFALPIALRQAQIANVCQTVGHLLDRGYRAFEAPDLTAWQLLQEWSPGCDALDITADWSWYAINQDAERRQIACGIRGNVTGPEANLPNLLETALLPKEILVAQYAPLFIAYTRPQTAARQLLAREGNRLHITQLGSLWITFDERPWSAQTHQAELLRRGYGDFRVDLSWAGAALPVRTWSEMLTATPKLDAHFATHRL